MNEALYDGLGKFSKNVLKVWEEEQLRDRRQRKLAAVGVSSQMIQALTQRHQRRAGRSVQRSRSSMAGASSRLVAVTRDDDEDRVNRSSTATLTRCVDTDGQEEDELPSIHHLALVSREEDNPHVLSTEAELSWGTSFHHLHHEAKKRERIRRLERLRLDREARDSDATLELEHQREAHIKAAATAKLNGIQKTSRRLQQSLDHLQEDEEAVRRQGFRRVQDTVRHSLLLQCGDTVPVAGECVKLLPLTLVEDAFHHYGLVCPHDLLQWSDVVGHVVEVAALKYRPSSNDAPAIAGKCRRLQDHRSAEDYQVMVRFGHVSQGTSHVFELFASCLQLAPDPALVPAPLVITDRGTLLELTKLNITFEIAGDTAIVTHQSTWVAPRATQKQQSFVDIALLCPLMENMRVASVSADVGDSKLRSVALDEQDGADFVKKCQQARAFRLQQVLSRTPEGGAADEHSSSSSTKPPHPMFTSAEHDPMAFVSEEVSASLPATGLRALGLWQDKFHVLPSVPEGGRGSPSSRPAKSPPRELLPELSLAAGVASPLSSAASPTTRSGADSAIDNVKGTLIPLKQLKVSELVHVQIQFHVDGVHVQRPLFRTGLPSVDSRASLGAIGENAVDFRFPCRYPDVCFNYEARRTFESVASLTVCVVGADSKHIHVNSAPRTAVDESPLLSAAFLKSANCVVVAQQAGPWGNHDIRLQIVHQSRAHPSSLSQQGGRSSSYATSDQKVGDDLEAAAFLDPFPLLQLDFFSMRIAYPFAGAPMESSVRRLINVLVDLRCPTDAECCDTTAAADNDESSWRQSFVENIHCAVLELIGRLSTDDMITFSVLTHHGWVMLPPHDETANPPPSGRSNNATLESSRLHPSGGLSARSHASRSLQPTPRGDLRSHRASTMWWRKSHINGHEKTHFFDRWMNLLLTSDIGAHCSSAATPTAAGDQKATAAWLKFHQHMSSLVHMEHGTEDAREGFLFSGAILSREAQQHVALLVSNSSHLSYRMHVAAFRRSAVKITTPPPTYLPPARELSPEASSAFTATVVRYGGDATAADDLSNATSLLWQITAKKSKGTFAVIPEGHEAQRLLLSMMTSCSGCVTSDVDVFIPATVDVAMLSDVRNLPQRGCVQLMGVASYGGAIASSATRPEFTGAVSATSPIENVTMTGKFSTAKKLVKRVPIVKLPAGTLANILGPKAMQYEVASSWFSRLVVGAQEPNQATSLRSGPSSTSATATTTTTTTPLHQPQALDVVECGCLLGVALRRGPYALEAACPPSADSPRSSPAMEVPTPSPQRSYSPTGGGLGFNGRSTRLYLFHQIVAQNPSSGGGGGMSSSHQPIRQTSITAAAYPPLVLGPPTALGSTLPLGIRNWRDASRHACHAQHLEMSIFVPFASSMDDVTGPAAAIGEDESFCNPTSTSAARRNTSRSVLNWVISHTDRFQALVSQLVAEEYAVRGEYEFEEWNRFLEVARSFHQDGASVQLRQLSALSATTTFLEDERTSRGVMVKEEAKRRQELLDTTADARMRLRRCAKHLREARQNVVYQEEDARQVLVDDVLYVQQVVRRSLATEGCSSSSPAGESTGAHADLMLSALVAFEHDSETVALLCYALVTWAFVPLHAQLLGHQGGVLRLKSLLQEYAQNARVVELVVCALHLLSKVPVNHCKLEHANVVGAVLAAMHCHARCEAVQYRCAQFLASVTRHSNGMRMSILRSPSGGVEHVLTLLTMWSHNTKMCLQTFRLVRNLVRDSIAHRFIAEEGVPTMAAIALSRWTAEMKRENETPPKSARVMIHSGPSKHSRTKHRDEAWIESMMLLLKTIGEVSSDRGARMVLAVQGSVSSVLVQLLESFSIALGGQTCPDTHMDGFNGRVFAAPWVLEEALRVVLKMSGNVADYPCEHLVGCLVHLLSTIERCLGKHDDSTRNFDASCDLIKTILTRFTLTSVPWLPESALYEPSLKPWFKPWTAITLLDTHSDPTYGLYPHPLACCYGRTVRAVLRLGHQDIPCVLRMFTNADMDRHIAGPGLMPDRDPSEIPAQLSVGEASIVKEQRRALFRCALALQLQDVVENTRTRSPHQLSCLGFSSWEDTHATIYTSPPRYTLRMVLLAMSAQRDPSCGMLLVAWVHLAIILMETLVYYERLQGKAAVHGNLDLDHIFCEDDVARECEPHFVVAPAVAIPVDVVDLVPSEADQQLFTKEEFAETASRTLLDDDNDARRALIEALYYGGDVEGEDEEGGGINDHDMMSMVSKRIPDSIAHAVFGLKAMPGGGAHMQDPSETCDEDDCFAASPYCKTPSMLLRFLVAYRDKHLYGVSMRASRQRSKRIPLPSDSAMNLSQISAI